MNLQNPTRSTSKSFETCYKALSKNFDLRKLIPECASILHRINQEARRVVEEGRRRRFNSDAGGVEFERLEMSHLIGRYDFI